jgi:hypothetical protein
MSGHEPAIRMERDRSTQKSPTDASAADLIRRYRRPRRAIRRWIALATHG